jgi:hypothetical protein
MPDDSYSKTAYERTEDAMREVGTLLVAFAPLDAVLTEPGRRGYVLLFFLVGALLFLGSLLLERSRRHVD